MNNVVKLIPRNAVVPAGMDWVNVALQRHENLSFVYDRGNYWLKGKGFTLPDGRKVNAELGYLRATGQFRENFDSECSPYDVEVFCCKSHKTAWVSANLVTGVRLIDDLCD